MKTFSSSDGVVHVGAGPDDGILSIMILSIFLAFYNDEDGVTVRLDVESKCFVFKWFGRLANSTSKCL